MSVTETTKSIELIKDKFPSLVTNLTLKVDYWEFTLPANKKD